MLHSEIEANLSLIQNDTIEAWTQEANHLNEPEGSLAAALHKMSQNVTVMLTTLELFQISGELLPQDVDILMNSAVELRDYIRLLRSTNTSNDD